MESGGRNRSYSVGANAMSPASLPIKYVSDTAVTGPGTEEKKALTVEYIVEQTFRTIAQMVVQARVRQVGEEGLYSDENGQWLNLKLDYSWQIDKELNRILPMKRYKLAEGASLDLIVDIFADSTKKQETKGNQPAKTKSGKDQPPQVLLERWTVQFTAGSNADLKNIPASINNKWTIVLLRSMCSMLRLLPAHNLVRLCKKQPTTFDIQYSLFSAPPTSQPKGNPTSPRAGLPSSSGSRRFDEDQQRDAASSVTKNPPKSEGGEKGRKPTTLFSFGSVKSKTGTLAASVEYLNDISQFEFKPVTIEPFVIADYMPPSPQPPRPVSNPSPPKTEASPLVQKQPPLASIGTTPTKPSPLAAQLEELKAQQAREALKSQHSVNETPQPQQQQPVPQQRIGTRPQQQGSFQTPTSPPIPTPSPNLRTSNSSNPIPIQKTPGSSGQSGGPSSSYPDMFEDFLISPREPRGSASPSLHQPPFPMTPPAFSSTPPPFSQTPPFSATPPFSSGSFGMYGSQYGTEKDYPFSGLLEGSGELRSSKSKVSISPHSPFKEPTLQDVQLKQSRSFHEEGPLISTYAPISASLPTPAIADDLLLDAGAFAFQPEGESAVDQVGEFIQMCSQPKPLKIFAKAKPLVSLEKIEGYHLFVNQMQAEINALWKENAKKRAVTDFRMDNSLLFGEGFLCDAPFPFDENDLGA